MYEERVKRKGTMSLMQYHFLRPSSLSLRSTWLTRLSFHCILLRVCAYDLKLNYLPARPRGTLRFHRNKLYTSAGWASYNPHRYKTRETWGTPFLFSCETFWLYFSWFLLSSRFLLTLILFHRFIFFCYNNTWMWTTFRYRVEKLEM